MQKPRLARLVLLVALAAGLPGGLAACSGGAKAGNGATNPPSTRGK